MPEQSRLFHGLRPTLVIRSESSTHTDSTVWPLRQRRGRAARVAIQTGEGVSLPYDRRRRNDDEIKTFTLPVFCNSEWSSESPDVVTTQFLPASGFELKT
jgi:hypothetical protein